MTNQINKIRDLYAVNTIERLKRDPLFIVWRSGDIQAMRETAKRVTGIEKVEELTEAAIKYEVEFRHHIILPSKEGRFGKPSFECGPNVVNWLEVKDDDTGLHFLMQDPVSIRRNFTLPHGTYHLNITIDLTLLCPKRDKGRLLDYIAKHISVALEEGERNLNQFRPFVYKPRDIEGDLKLLGAYEKKSGGKATRLRNVARQAGLIDYSKISDLEIPSEEAKAADKIRKRLAKVHYWVYGEPLASEKATAEPAVKFPCNGCPDRDREAHCPCSLLDDFYKKDFILREKAAYPGLGQRVEKKIE